MSPRQYLTRSVVTHRQKISRRLLFRQKKVGDETKMSVVYKRVFCRDSSASIGLRSASNLTLIFSSFFHSFLTPTMPSVSLRQKGARQTGRAQRPQPESTPDWDPAQAGGAH